jgi:flagellar motor protein MotB
MISRRNSEYDNHDESGHYWISISDLMTSLLFIFILILAYTIFTFSKKQEAFNENFTARAELLKSLQQELKESNIDVDIDPENGNMRIRADTFFTVGSADLSSDGARKLAQIAQKIKVKINDDKYHKAIDTIFIEGHTDNKPLSQINGNRRWTNMELSSQRAINSFLAMDSDANISNIKNSSNKFLFSYSGYSDSRPVDISDSDEARAKNRRIEFFFALSSPKIAQ